MEVKLKVHFHWIIETDLVPFVVTFLTCLFYSLQIGILIGTAINLAMLCYSTARPKVEILKTEVYFDIPDIILSHR